MPHPSPFTESSLLPLKRMQARYEAERGDSDVAAFHCLLYYGEMLTKLVVLGLLAGVEEDRERARYSVLHGLVRANAIGDWEQALQNLLQGPASQHLRQDFRQYQRDLTERLPKGTWQNEAVQLLHHAAGILSVPLGRLDTNISGRQWFPGFVTLRNKTRGHGAPLGHECAKALPELERSITLIHNGLTLFRAPWAYLHRNLSGKYRVTPLGGDPSGFEYLKSTADVALANGVYLFSAEPRHVELADSDTEALDCLLPNGQYSGDTFELLSYITNERRRSSGTQYQRPPNILVNSETQGQGELEEVGGVFSNLPPSPPNYVRRPELERQLLDSLLHDRHEVVTLSGPGGVGKTSTAIQVLHDLSKQSAGRFACIIWFSARDIDLLDTGPKPVRPHGISAEDFASDFIQMLAPAEAEQKGFKPLDYLGRSLAVMPLGPTIFVLDNFETVADPASFYKWLDAHVRRPNKILITTRMRDFLGDLPIEVRGMNEAEASQLISLWSELLGVQHRITREYKQDIYREADGHPYVMKILLGEVARSARLSSPERIVASREDILVALFERTYANISPAAQRLFLLLSSWRSAVPTVCVEAVMLSNAEERLDVQAAIDELRRFSLIDEFQAPDSQSFLSVPLAAAVFGKRKLPTHPYRLAIEADNRLLQKLGPTSKDQVRFGIEPRLRRLLSGLAAGVSDGELDLTSQLPMLEYIAARCPAMWLDIARLCEEQDAVSWLDHAAKYIRRFIEAGASHDQLWEAWNRLASLSLRRGDDIGYVHALVSMCELHETRHDQVSHTANALNTLFASAKRDGRLVLPPEQKRYSLERVAAALERHASTLDGDGYSRLAWLYLNLGDETRAGATVNAGLRREPNNAHLMSLRDRGIG